MRLATKRALDYYLGRPALGLLQISARVLALIWRRNHDIEPIRSILLVKFQGLGSLVIAKPAIAELRRQQPTAQIIFWGTPALRPLAEQMPEFDVVLVLDDRSLVSAVRSAMAGLATLWRRRIDWAIDLEVYSRLSSVLVTLTCARNRAGFALEQLRGRRVHTHLVYFNRHRHLGEAYARILGLLLGGARVNADDYGAWRFSMTPVAGVTAPYFVFNIHAGDLALERRWPRENFDKLIDELLHRHPDATAVMIGHGPAEETYAAGMRSRDRLLNLTGKLTLIETFRLLAHATLVVTNDSAPLHFALSVGAPTVGLFGPTRAETYLPPQRKTAAAAYIELYCSPCVHFWEPLPCHGDNQCMKRLTVSRVLELCEGLAGDRMPATPARDWGEETASDYYPGLVYRRPDRSPLA